MVETVQNRLEVLHVEADVFELVLSCHLTCSEGIEACLRVRRLLVGQVRLVRVRLFRAEVFNHFNGEDDLGELGNLLPLLGTGFLFVVLQL